MPTPASLPSLVHKAARSGRSRLLSALPSPSPSPPREPGPAPSSSPEQQQQPRRDSALNAEVARLSAVHARLQSARTLHDKLRRRRRQRFSRLPLPPSNSTNQWGDEDGSSGDQDERRDKEDSITTGAVRMGTGFHGGYQMKADTKCGIQTQLGFPFIEFVSGVATLLMVAMYTVYGRITELRSQVWKPESIS